MLSNLKKNVLDKDQQLTEEHKELKDLVLPDGDNDEDDEFYTKLEADSNDDESVIDNDIKKAKETMHEEFNNDFDPEFDTMNESAIGDATHYEPGDNEAGFDNCFDDDVIGDPEFDDYSGDEYNDVEDSGFETSFNDSELSDFDGL